MIYILYKELKDLSGLLQKSAYITEALGGISSNESEIWEAESCLDQRWREVATDLVRYSCSVCLHSTFQYVPLLLLLSDTHWWWLWCLFHLHFIKQVLFFSVHLKQQLPTVPPLSAFNKKTCWCRFSFILVLLTKSNPVASVKSAWLALTLRASNIICLSLGSIWCVRAGAYLISIAVWPGGWSVSWQGYPWRFPCSTGPWGGARGEHGKPASGLWLCTELSGRGSALHWQKQKW